MKVFYTDAEQAYAPEHSFFTGRFTPYPDVPGRTRSLLAALERCPAAQVLAPPPVAHEQLERVHAGDYLETLRALCTRLEPGEAFFPFNARPLPLLQRSPYPRVRMGNYALDGATPLLSTSYTVAHAVAATAIAGAGEIASGAALAYALARPPGHHAGRAYFAGYCLLNNAALAADVLLGLGKVAILDVDYHHGNGTQDVFWERDDVFYASLHCRPEEAYPYAFGAADEQGSGKGRGLNLNLPLPGGTDWESYRPALEQALEAVRRFGPASLVVSLGFDTLATDPIGSFALNVADYGPMARLIGALQLPTLLVQEGGYDVDSIGGCLLSFLAGLGLEAPPTA